MKTYSNLCSIIIPFTCIERNHFLNFFLQKETNVYVCACMCVYTQSLICISCWTVQYLLPCSSPFYLIIHIGCNIQSIDISFNFFQLHTLPSSFFIQISFPQMTFRWFPYFAFANNDKMNNRLHVLVFSFADLFQNEFLEVELLLLWKILPISPPCGYMFYTPTSNL